MTKKLQKLFLFSIPLFIVVVALALVSSVDAVRAAEPLDPMAGDRVMAAPLPDEYAKAKVTAVIEEGERSFDNGAYRQPYQVVKVRILSGPETGTELELQHGYDFTIRVDQMVKVGETVVLMKTQTYGRTVYLISDKYRLPWVGVIVAIFIAAAVFFGRLKGIGSVVGLLISIIILAKYIVPTIVSGGNPVTTSLMGAIAIAVLSLYPAHGFSRRTTVALLSMLLSLGLAVGLAELFTTLTKLFGLGTEEAFYIQTGLLENVDLKGLLLGGIIIGVLGVLDDVSTGAAAAVDEIHKANTTFSFTELYRRGLSVGREHITSLVNTLALAYIGASFPLLLLFTTTAALPFWVALNAESIVEEVIRTLVGSTTLVLAVPITTALMAYTLKRWPRNDQPKSV